MKRWFMALILIAILIFATAATAMAAQHGPPGPGNSHNGGCTGPPSDRIGNCNF